MKLLYKNILINTIASIIILFLGEYSLYYFLNNKIENETIEHLYFEKELVNKALKQGVDIANFKTNVGDDIAITKVDTLQYDQGVIKEFEVKEEYEDEYFTSKKIVFDVEQNKQFYRVNIIKTFDGTEGIIESLSLILFVSGLCLLIILIVLNMIVYSKLFSPLSKLIVEIKSFSVHNLKKIIAPKTSTLEFSELGDNVSLMSEKIISDYTSMKEFTENMTHEIQTPLAVIQAKIEICLQDKALSETQAILLTDSTKAINKLVNISKGLSLLSKLDNGEFTSTQNKNITSFIHERVSYFSDFIESKELIIEEHYENDIVVKMEASLCEILIDNIFKNAIKHNIQQGKIIISTKSNQLIISNTGYKPQGSVEDFFKRFYSKHSSISLGLGLSIVKKIVEIYNFKISYKFESNLHSITVDFN